MSVHQLSTKNFHISDNRQTLNIDYSGNVLVFFKIQDCDGCAAFEPVFHQLAREEKQASAAILDLTYNRDIIHMSRRTSTPIHKVPHLLLYVQGRPHARFKGEKTIDALRNFINDALKVVQPSQQHTFVQQQPQNIPQPQNIYGGAQPRGGSVFMPDIQPSKQAINMAQGSGGQAHPSMQQQCDPDTDECLLIPEQVIPHNMPWGGDYKKLTGVI